MNTEHEDRLLDLYATTKRKIQDLQTLADRSTDCAGTQRLVAKASGARIILEDMRVALNDIGIVVPSP